MLFSHRKTNQHAPVDLFHMFFIALLRFEYASFISVLFECNIPIIILNLLNHNIFFLPLQLKTPLLIVSLTLLIFLNHQGVFLNQRSRCVENNEIMIYDFWLLLCVWCLPPNLSFEMCTLEVAMLRFLYTARTDSVLIRSPLTCHQTAPEVKYFCYIRVRFIHKVRQIQR